MDARNTRNTKFASGLLALLITLAVAAPAGAAREQIIAVRGESATHDNCSNGGRCLRLVFVLTIRVQGGDEVIERRVVEMLGTAHEALERAFGARLLPVARRVAIELLGRAKGARRRAGALKKELLARQSYELWDGVELTPRIEGRLARIADEFRKARKRRLEITSGSRSPESQASAMYGKLLAGGSLVRTYLDKKSAGQIERAFFKARKRGAGKKDTVAAMADVIRSQIKRGVYISKHLHGGALDVRSVGMSSRDRATLKRIIAKTRGVTVLQERRPPHFHLQFD